MNARLSSYLDTRFVACVGVIVATLTASLEPAIEAGGEHAPARTNQPTHWVILTENLESNQQVDPSRLYRLTVGSDQLIPSGNSIGVRSIRERRPNVRFPRAVHDPNYGDALDGGPNVRLHEPVALYFPGKGYLVFHKGDKRLRWQTESNFSLLNAPGVYQWRLRSPPRWRVRDHRDRTISTGETLGLYNEIRASYLVQNRNTRKLEWWKP